MKKIKNLFVVVPVAFIFLSVSMPRSPFPPTNTDLLTDTSWVILDATTYPQYYDTASEAEITDMLILWPSCAEDNYIKFYNDDTYMVNEGGTICGENGTQWILYDWYFDGDEDTIIFVQWENDTIVAELLKLEADTLRFRYIELGDDQVNHTNTITYIPRET